LLKRWLARREFAIYYLLYRYSRSLGGPLNYGQALDIVRGVVGSRKVADSILRQLICRGLLRKTGNMSYTVVEPDVLFHKVLVYYIAGRLRRRGLEAYVEDDRIVVRGETVNHAELSEIESLVPLLKKAGIEVRVEHEQ